MVYKCQERICPLVTWVSTVWSSLKGFTTSSPFSPAPPEGMTQVSEVRACKHQRKSCFFFPKYFRACPRAEKIWRGSPKLSSTWRSNSKSKLFWNRMVKSHCRLNTWTLRSCLNILKVSWQNAGKNHCSLMAANPGMRKTQVCSSSSPLSQGLLKEEEYWVNSLNNFLYP